MKNLKGFVFYVTFIACVSSKHVKLTPKLQKLFVDEHNEYRRNEGASNMNELVWSQKIADTASKWIGRCDFEHMRKELGENLWYSTMVKTLDAGIEEALKDWFDEKFLPGSSYSCGSRCHYTQLVWAKTSEVGCAIEECKWLSAFGSMAEDATYIACFYNPKGNWNGQSTYETGVACDDCADGQTCANGLCRGKGKPKEEVCEDKNPDCSDWASFGECKNNKKYMDKKCAKSCGVCKGGTGEVDIDCSDNEKKCAGWASKGECRRNPQYMNSQCRKSCNKC